MLWSVNLRDLVTPIHETSRLRITLQQINERVAAHRNAGALRQGGGIVKGT